MTQENKNGGVNIYYNLIVDGQETNERVAKGVLDFDQWCETMGRVPGLGFVINRIEGVKDLAQKNIDDALAVLQDMDADNELLPESILSAIIAGKIPNVEWVG